MTKRWISAVLAVWLLSSCGGGDTTEAEPVEETTSGDEATETSAEAEVPSPPADWESMSHQEQAEWMGAEVVPRMAAMFAAYDGERYANVNCGTCHGPGAASGEFDMPSNSLPALPPTGTDEQHAMVQQYGTMVRFMFNDVLPTMQTLVGGADFDEDTGEGFSCFSCHPHQGDEGSTLISLDEEPAEASEGE